jgi:N-acetylmuramoyl-L-alanine amidase
MINSPVITAGNPVKVVVIDAGHGGHDPGAIGVTGVREKDITLKIALKLGTMITQNHPSVKVIYTRKTDMFVELYRRAQIANNNHADIFISIHCNAVDKPNVYGTETFIMGLDKSNQNLAVAEKENAAILSERNHENNYDGFDPSSPEAYIVFSLYQNAYLSQSAKLAAAIQSELKTSYDRVDRGVKQAPFLVLWRTAMPSLLIETGFISNKNEESYLSSDKGQTDLATAIYKAFAKESQFYAAEIAAETDADKEPERNAVSTETTKMYAIQFLTSPVRLKKTDPKLKNLPDIEIDQIGSQYRYTSGKYQTQSEAQKALTQVRKSGFSDAFVVSVKIEQKAEPAMRQTETTAIDTVGRTSDTTQTNVVSADSRLPVVYRVQFLYASRLIDKADPELKNLPNITIEKVGAGYKYLSGNCETHAQARELLIKVKKAGFSDAFIAAYDSDKPVSSVQTSSDSDKPQTSTVVSDAKQEVIYRIQFMTMPVEYKKTAPELKNLPDITIEKSGKQYIYMTGHCVSYTEAQKLLSEVKKKGFTDAYIVAYQKDGKRITLQKARELK